MTGFETGRCADTQLPEGAQVPDRIHLLPVGAVQGRDGRSWTLNDPKKVIDASMTGVDLPIDYEQQMDDPKARVDQAVSSGHMPPAFRDWALALCRQDRKMFDTFVDAIAPTFAHLFKR